MTKPKKNNTEDFKIPARFILIILLLIVYVIYVYVVGWNKALLYYTYFLLFILFFNISINTKNTEKLSKYNDNKCNNIKFLIDKLKSEYERCICGKKLSSNICKTGFFEYNSKLLANDSDKNFINLNNIDNVYKLKNEEFPRSIY